MNIDNPLGTDTSVNDATEAFAEMMDPQEDNPDVGEAQMADETEVEDAEYDETEAQAEDESDESEDDEDQEEQSEEPYYLVKINGEEVEVPLSEALKGYQRQADYSRKTEELARLRREAEAQINAETEAIRQERERYAQVLQQLSQQVNQPEEQIDWDRLRQEDPIEYAAKFAEVQQKRERQQALMAEQQRIAQQQMYEQQQLAVKHLQLEQVRLIEAIPEWTDKETAKREKGEIIDFAKSIGFSDEELSQAVDHRAILALRDAMKYRKLVAKKPEVKPVTKVKAVRPGSQNSVKAKSKFKDAQQRLAKSGRVDDAARAFESLLFGE